MNLQDLSLQELEVLRRFKAKMPGLKDEGNRSPFELDVAISQATADEPSADVEEIHAAQRERITLAIQEVRQGMQSSRQRSKVILLYGDPGTGKTHLIQSFRSPRLQTQHKYVFVSGSNHWKVQDFLPVLLDWILEAITSPSPTQEHLLLDRIRALAFCAIEQLLKSPIEWKARLARPARRWWQRWLPRRSSVTHDKLKKLLENRDDRLFAYFDEIKLGDYLCDRFLTKASDQTHRYVLRVLLTYLYPNTGGGLSSRERVINWFRRQADESYFVSRFGVHITLDKDHAVLQAIRLLMHLFSPEVCSRLHSDKHPCEPRVFFVAFDQIEGRHELFEREADWMDFFAHLSELYNSLPNVLIVFTMTLTQRALLANKMERQFRDRIAMSEDYALRFPTIEQLHVLYERRIEAWLQDEPDLRQAYMELPNRCIPLTSAEIVAEGRVGLRQALKMMDRLFRARMGMLVVGPKLDYLYKRNDLLPMEQEQGDYEYTQNHIETVTELFNRHQDVLPKYGLRLRDMKHQSWTTTKLLRMEIELQTGSPHIVVTLARVSKQYKAAVERLIQECLYDRERIKNFLVIVRALKFDPDYPERYADQILIKDFPKATESTLRALCHLAENVSNYDKISGGREHYQAVVQEELAKTYIDEMLAWVRRKLDARVRVDSGVNPAQNGGSSDA